MLRYWGFWAPFRPIFLENAAHNTAEYGMSRPAGRRRRRQAVSHTRTPVCAAICEFSAGFEAGFARYRSTHGERARGKVNPGEARSGQAGQERTWPRAGAGPNGPSGMGWAAWLGRGSFRRRKARNSGYINQNHINTNSDLHPTVTTNEAGRNAGQQEITRGGRIILSPQCYI